MLAQGAKDRAAVGLDRGHLLQILGREAAAEIDHGQIDPALGAGAENHRRRFQRVVPGLGAALLRADMERHAIGLEPAALGVLEHVDRHLRIAAEFSRERPLGAGAVEQEPAEHPCRRRDTGDLVDLRLAVHREQPHAERIGARNVTLLLDGVAEGDAVRRGASREHHLDLRDRGGIEAGTQRHEEREQLGRRIGLHRVIHPAVRQRLCKALIIFAHDVEIDDEAGSILAAVAQEFTDALGHGALLTTVQRALRPD